MTALDNALSRIEADSPDRRVWHVLWAIPAPGGSVGLHNDIRRISDSVYKGHRSFEDALAHAQKHTMSKRYNGFIINMATGESTPFTRTT
jgi:hypothetical protein